MENLLVLENINSNVKFLKDKYNLVPKENLFLTDSKSNIDKCIIFDSQNVDVDLIHMLKVRNIPTIGDIRSSKKTQHEILKSLGINTPNTFYTYNPIDNVDDFYTVTKDIPNDVSIILKDSYGARSLGSVILDSKDVFYKLLQEMKFTEEEQTEVKRFDKLIPDIHTYEKDIEDKIKFLGRMTENSEREYSLDFLRDGDYVIQPLIGVAIEYRCMVFANGEIMVKNRNKERLFGDKKITAIAREDTFKETAFKLLEYTDLPFLSIDFYETDDREIGVFEFQMQMGYTDVDKTMIVENVLESVDIKFKEK